MKRWWWAAAIVAAAIIAIATIDTGSAPTRDEAPPAATGDAPAEARLAPAASAAAPAGPSRAEARRPQPSGTRPIEHPATAADGFIEVRALAGGKPLAGARVTLYERGEEPGGSFRLAGAGATGADGGLRLPARAGRYLVSARGGGLAPARQEVQRPAGEPVTRVVLELAAPSSLAGRVVAKQGKEAVPLAEIVLAAGAAPPEEEARATADTSGRFRFDGLAPGRYRAEASASGYARATRQLEVPGGEVTLELLASSFIEGFVVDALGQPAGGALITASVAPEPATGAPEPATATATGSGSFSLEVEPRTWQLAARRGDEAGALDAPVTVLAGATARGVRIALGAAAGIAGTVVAQQPGAAVAQLPGAPGAGPGAAATGAWQPVAGAAVAVSRHDARGSEGRAVTDAAGAFAVTGLAPGSYDVEIGAEGFGTEVRRGVTVNAGQRFPLRVELHGTGAVEGWVRDASGRGVPGALVLDGTAASARADDGGAYRMPGLLAGHRGISARRDGAAGGETRLADIREGATARLDFTLKDEGLLAGRVIGKGKRIAWVRAIPMTRGQGTTAPTIPVDPDGGYSASLPEGSYGVDAAWAGGGRQSRREFVAIEPGRTVRHDITLPDDPGTADAFSGTVLEPDGTPSAHAHVVARANGHFAFASTTDETGAFQAARPRADLPDTFTLEARSGGRKGTALVAPQQADAVVQLLPAAALRGQVIAAGAPPDSFIVSAAGQSLEFAGDRFELRDLPGEKVHVVVSTRDGRTGQADVALAPGATSEVEVALVEDAVLLGRALDEATRAPLANALVSVGQASGYSGADGRFRLANLPPGELTVRVWLEGWQSFQKKAALASAAPLDLGDVLLQRLRAGPGTIGIQLRGDSEGVRVVGVVDGSPADRAGLRTGDAIVAVDGAAVNGVDDARRRISGAPGAPVQITVLRNGTERLVIPVIRAS